MVCSAPGGILRAPEAKVLVVSTGSVVRSLAAAGAVDGPVICRFGSPPDTFTFRHISQSCFERGRL